MKQSLFFFILLSFTSCKEEKWIGLLYKDERVMSNYEVYGHFRDSKSCIQVGQNTASLFENGAFECGLNCELRNGDLYVCEKTVDTEE